MNKIQKFTHSSGRPGPAILIFGAIHGNETCGTKAIRAVQKKLTSGSLVLKRGSVTLVPICNPRAYTLRRRFIDVDLNRVFKKWRTPKTYEQHLANQLCDLVRSHDVLLDLHSTTAATVPFTFLDTPKVSNMRFLAALGIRNIISGWAALYSTATSDTQSCAARCGADSAVVECGQHQSSTAVRVAERSIMRTLAAYNLIDKKYPAVSTTVIRIELLIHKTHPKEELGRKWRNFARVRKGDPLIKLDGSVKARAPFNGVVIMPKHNAELTEEYIYFGRLV